MNYIYGMRLRGFAPLCQPKDGFVERRNSNKYHDILVYNRKLTNDELRAYELDFICAENQSEIFDRAKSNDDFVEVVRCKDCKFTETDGCEPPAIYCEKWDRWEMPEDAYCYLGKRRK